MNPVKKRKLALIGHTYSLAHNRWKAATLSKYYDVKCYVPELKGKDVLGRSMDEIDSTAEPGEDYETIYLPKAFLKEKTTGFTLKNLSKELSSFAPDVILLENEPWSMLRWQAWVCAKKLPTKPVFVEFTWENLKRTGWKGLFTNNVYRFAARYGDLVICGNSVAQKIFVDAGKPIEQTLVAGQLGVPSERIVAPSEQEKEAWRESFGFAKDSYVIGYCGRFVEEKGILDLLKAVESIDRQGQKREVRLVLLGAGELEPEIKLRLEGLGVIHEAVDHHQVPDLMKQMDLTVLPSKPLNKNGQIWEEQFGRVIIESIYSETPCIGSSSGAIPEVLNDERAVFDHGDIDALKALILSCMDEPWRETLLRRQIVHIKENYTHEAIAKHYYNFIS